MITWAITIICYLFGLQAKTFAWVTHSSTVSWPWAHSCMTLPSWMMLTSPKFITKGFVMSLLTRLGIHSYCWWISVGRCYDFTVLLFNWLSFFLYELRLRTLCAQWTYHMIPARLLICFLSLSHVLGSCTCMFLVLFYMFSRFTVLDCRLIYAYRSVLRFTFYGSSTRLQSRYP